MMERKTGPVPLAANQLDPQLSDVQKNELYELIQSMPDQRQLILLAQLARKLKDGLCQLEQNFKTGELCIKTRKQQAKNDLSTNRDDVKTLSSVEVRPSTCSLNTDVSIVTEESSYPPSSDLPMLNDDFRTIVTEESSFTPSSDLMVIDDVTKKSSYPPSSHRTVNDDVTKKSSYPASSDRTVNDDPTAFFFTAYITSLACRCLVIMLLMLHNSSQARAPKFTLANSTKHGDYKYISFLINFLKLFKPPKAVILDEKEFEHLKPNMDYKEGKNYKTIEILGEGQNGQVFLVEDNKTKNCYAKKVMKFDCCGLQEIDMMGELNDSHITPKLSMVVLNFETCKIELFMEILQGYKTKNIISQLMEIYPVPDDHILHFGLHAGLALHKTLLQMHKFKWYHRDLQEENIMWFPGAEQEVKFIDFGNAASVEVWSWHPDATQLQEALKFDLACALKVSTSILIGGDHFDNVFDFRKNYEKVITEKASKQQKFLDALLSSIKDGLMITSVEQEEKFVHELEKKWSRIIDHDAVKEVGLNFQFQTLHQTTKNNLQL